MKKERVEFHIDSFVDENGNTRHFVIAAISERFDEPMEVFSYIWNVSNQEVVKGLKLGYAICNPIDKFDEELGCRIAEGRARKNSEYALLATQLGYINTKMVRAFLEQEAEYFKDNPERYIKGYKRFK